MKDEKLYREVERNVNEIKIFDTHEHIMYESDRRSKKLDFFMIFFDHYASTDLVTAGLSPDELQKLLNPDIDLKIKWDIFQPFWQYIKNTTYSLVITTAVNDLYGIHNIDLNNIIKITEQLEEKKEVEYYNEILREKSNIEFILNDIDEIESCEIKEPDCDYFLPVMRLDDILELNSIEKLTKIEKDYNISIYKFSNFISFIDEIFEKRKNKIYALKIGVAYNNRNIIFEEVSYSEAEKSFLKILKLNNYQYPDSISLKDIKPFQDYIYHYCIEKVIEEYNLPIQIHTGILEGNANDISNSNPKYLIKLLLKYKKGKFDIFHAGYPYTDELIVMAKMFQNSYFNLCWIPEFSKILYKRILELLMDTLPSNKIFAFGGDYFFVEGTYVAQKIVREIITEILYEKILNKHFSFEDGVEFAYRILNKNSKAIYLPTKLS